MKESIFHLSVKVIQRSAGRSATGAIAYRAGIDITDERTGLRFDYTRKTGVSYSEIIAPAVAPAKYRDRNTLWNAVETKETRVNSTVAREFEVALPADLPRAAREKLARDFTQWLVDRFGFIADLNMHDPHPRKDDADGEESKNFHAHILTTTRRVDADGFTEKCRELDSAKTGGPLVEEVRAQYAEMMNKAYEEHQVQRFVDHRSFARRGIDKEPTIHIGVNHDGERAELNDQIKARNTIRDAVTAIEQDKAHMQEMLARLQTAPLVVALDAPQEPDFIETEEPPPPQPVQEPPPQVRKLPRQLELDLRAQLVEERQTLLALKRDAGVYGLAQVAYAEKVSDLASLRRSVSALTPPRLARVHQMMDSKTWRDYVKKREGAMQLQRSVSDEVAKLAAVIRNHKPKAEQWDRQGYARLKHIESVLSRDVTSHLEPVQKPQSSPSRESGAVFDTSIDIFGP